MLEHSLQELSKALLEQFAQSSAFCQMRFQNTAYLLPISVDEQVQWADLLHIDTQKARILENMQHFLAGNAYNHMLLWGARGTGKSSLIRALFHLLKNQGLKMLQLACDDLEDLAFLLWLIAQTPDKFLIYIDDLSFSDKDGSYRALKAVLDGSLSGISPNIVLCVSSNRRHLLAEHHQDARALHPDEDVEEQISLSERFGLRLAFHPLSQQQFLDTAAYWANKKSIVFSQDLCQKALRFSLARGSRSARVAEQFVRQLHQEP